MLCLQHALWLRKGHSPSTSAGQSEKPPSVGEKRWVDMAPWHPLSLGMKVWVLFRPPHSRDEGIERHPQEIEQWVVIECEVVEFADFLPVAPFWEAPRDAANDLYCCVRSIRLGLPFTSENWREFPHLFEMKGWAQVRVLRVVPLLQIPLHFSEGEGDEVTVTELRQNERSYETPNLVLETAYAEDAYEWRVRIKATPSRAVLRAFDLVDEPAEICNCVCRE